MTDNTSFNTIELDKELVSLKKDETVLVKELQHVVDFFNRALLFKEKLRSALMGKIINLEKLRNDNFEKLKKVIRNLEIYDKNLEELAERKSALTEKERKIKSRYEEVLHGSSSDSLTSFSNEEAAIFGDISQDLLNISQNLQKINKTADKEELMKCREEYLSGLQRFFGKLDEELVGIDNEKGKLRKFHFEIKRKKDKANKQQAALKKNYNLLVEDIKKKKVDLEVSIQEERLLMGEYRKLVSQIQINVKINKETEELLDRILSSSDLDDPLNGEENGP